MPDKQESPAVQIALLQKDIATFDKYFNKIDVTLERLAEATSQITKIIALHEERLEQSLHDAGEIKDLIEQRRIEIKDLENKFDQTSLGITNSIQNLKEEIFIEIKKSATSSDQRFKKLEVWRYIIVGGALVIMFFASEFTKSFFDKYWTQQQINTEQVLTNSQQKQINSDQKVTNSDQKVTNSETKKGEK
jgi:hypothetical protein